MTLDRTGMAHDAQILHAVCAQHGIWFSEPVRERGNVRRRQPADWNTVIAVLAMHGLRLQQGEAHEATVIPLRLVDGE